MFSRRELMRIIIPLLIEQALSVTVGMADTIMVAQAGEAAVSGVSLVDSVNLLLLYFLGSLSTGGAVLISQAIGAQKQRIANDAKKQLVWISFLMGVALTLIMVPFRKVLLRMIFGSVSAEIMASAQIYFFYTALSYPFIALRNAGGAIYSSFGNTKVSMYLSLLTNALNIGGNALLILHFKMGAAGAAIATLIARFVGAVIILLLMCDKKRVVYVERILHFRPNFKLIKRILSIGIPNGFESSMFQMGKVVTQSIVSTFGSVAIAANAAANTFTSVLYIPGTAISAAITTVVGRCIGAGEKEQAKRYALRLVGLVYAIITVMAVGMSLLSRPLVGTFRLSPEAETLAINLFILHNICVCTIWPTAFTLPSAFRAASDVQYTVIVSLSSMWVFRVGGAILFAKVLGMGVVGVWYGMACDWVFRASLFAIRYFRGSWLKKYKKLS